MDRRKMLIALAMYSGKGHIHIQKRWFEIENVITFQPSELTKVIMIVVIAKMFDLLKERLHKFSPLVIVGIFMGIPTFLILIQTDLSTSIVLFGCFVV
jgi:rod shape determining protein RodA